MQKIKLYTILSLAFIYALSCKRTDDDKAVYNLNIPKEKLIGVMIDLNVAEGATQLLLPNQMDSIRSSYLTQILTIHNVNKIDLDEALKQLYAQPKLNEEFQLAVLDSIRKIETNMLNKAN